MIRAGIAILKIMLTLATVLFTNTDATFHTILTLNENKNTITYTDRGLKSPKSLFFWYPSTRRYQKPNTPKILESWGSRGLKSPKSFLYVWYPFRKMQGFGGKCCHFLRRYKKTNKPKILESWGSRGLKSPKSFFVCLVPLPGKCKVLVENMLFLEEVPELEN